MNRLFVDIKEDHAGNITGSVKFPADSVFVFEVLAEVVWRFSEACEVPPAEVAADLYRFIKGKYQ